ncbi:MAG: hypothetical protein ABR583_04185 [Gaiellaceae bacterium]
MTTFIRPASTYPVCADWHDSVPASGFTFSDHFHPGSKVPRPAVMPPNVSTSRCPFATNGRVSSGFSKVFASSFDVVVAIPASSLGITADAVEPPVSHAAPLHANGPGELTPQAERRPAPSELVLSLSTVSI